MTIKDLAKILSLSKSTVSRALSDHPDISEATKRRVRNAAAEFNYTKNIHAGFFRKQHSGLIALILPEINMFFTPQLIAGINKIMSESNYSLITFLSHDHYQIECDLVKQCLSWAVEGVFISLSKETADLNHLRPLHQAKIKCVLLDKARKSNIYPSVTIDSVKASYQAVNHLIEKGHRNILGIFGNPNFSISQERIKGYERALKENNIPIAKENIISVNKDSDLNYILPPILNHSSITGIFTMSDELLIRSLYHINRLQLSIPKDLSIISISDGVYPYLSYPQITHIRDSGTKMGESASRLLLDAIAHPGQRREVDLILSTELVELASVSRI